MKDPYILENGTLRNKLDIANYQELKQAETDIGYVKLINASEVITLQCDANLLRRVHKHIFEDIFDRAGEFRTIPIYKREIVIPGVSLEYSMPENIENDLKLQIDNLNAINWKGKDIIEFSKEFSKRLAKIWRVHPFRDGNTRTALTFASIFTKQNGFDMDLSEILNELGRKKDEKTGRIMSYSVRDRFVLASLDGEYMPEPMYLEWIIRRAMERGVLNKQNKINDEER